MNEISIIKYHAENIDGFLWQLSQKHKFINSAFFELTTTIEKISEQYSDEEVLTKDLLEYIFEINYLFGEIVSDVRTDQYSIEGDIDIFDAYTEFGSLLRKLVKKH